MNARSEPDSDTHYEAAGVSPRTRRGRLWFELHSWVGLKLTLLMSFVLLTGTFAVLAHEIDWLLNPAMRVTPQSGRPPASWGQLYDAARSAVPDSRITSIDAPIDPWFAARAVALTGWGERVYVHLDPWTAEVRGVTSWFNVHRFLRQAHRHLMLPVRLGVPIVASLSVLLAISLVSSWAIYRKWWRGFFARPRPHNARRFLGDLHRLAGVWSMWFVLLMTATGLWYLVESLGGAAQPFHVPLAAPRPVDTEEVSGARIDELAVRAGEAFPRLRIEAIQLPARPGEPVRFQGEAEAWLVRPRANFVAVDPVSLRVAAVQHGTQASVHQRIAEMADPLHFGYFGGLATKLIWFVFGLALSALSLTGAALYSVRVTRSLTREYA